MFVVVASAFLLAHASADASWDRPRVGTNFFNEVETRERFHAAAAAGLRLVRLAPDKWHGAGRDFLLGDASDFRGIPAADLARLKAVLDDAAAEDVDVVVTMLSLPGCRWKQHNGDKNDFRLYLDAKYQEQAARFWGELALALRDHPAVVGYNLLNEPRPERDPRARDVDIGPLYRKLIAAIRAVDKDTPIILDGTDDASPAGLAKLQPVDDPHVIYSFHFYEPWEYIDHRQKDAQRFPPHDRQTLQRLMAPVAEWQKKHALASARIWLAEYGVPRTKPGAATWLGDVTAIATAQGWHRSFYSFREDTWDAMDYELGDRPLGAAYWQAVERHEKPVLRRGPNPLWNAVRPPP